MSQWWEDVPAAPRLPAARRAADREMLEGLATHGQPERARVRRPLVLAAGGLALATATGAAIAYLGTGEITDRTEVECHTTVEVARGGNFAGVGVRLQDPFEYASRDSGVNQVDDAIGLCADLWAQGALQLGVRGLVEPTGAVEEVPPLTLCVTDQGIAAVFPAEQDVCSSLGLRGVQQ